MVVVCVVVALVDLFLLLVVQMDMIVRETSFLVEEFVGSDGLHVVVCVAEEQWQPQRL